MNKNKKIIDRYESPLRKIISKNKYIALKDLKEAKEYKDSYLIMEGDWGGQIYLTFPVRLIKCDYKTLNDLLRKIDKISWQYNKDEGSGIYFESHNIGEKLMGGMDGGIITPNLWVHKNLEFIKGEIASVLRGKVKIRGAWVNEENRTNLLSRLELRKKLKEYVNGIITLKNLQDWELKMSHEDFRPDDWEGDDSFINEVMHEIDMSDIDGLSINKAKEIIKLLKLNETTKILTRRLYKLK